jgi:streptomycin 6-kinase
VCRVRVPELVRQRAAGNGELGHLAQRWRLQLGDPFDGGTASYVVAATADDGRPCVLKIAMPLETDDDRTFARSVLVHRLAAGRACAELLADDLSVPAVLLERLGPSLGELAAPVPVVLETITDTLRSFWRPVAGDCGLPTGAEKAAWLADYITQSWDVLGRPCERAVVDRAVECCAERIRSFDDAAAVLVHGDAHGWNTLSAGDGTFKLVDPEGLRSEPAHDLSVPMREYNEPLLAGDTPALVRERAGMLADRCGVDAEAVWQWGYIERVSTGFTLLREMEGGGGEQFIEVAARCL